MLSTKSCFREHESGIYIQQNATLRPPTKNILLKSSAPILKRLDHNFAVNLFVALNSTYHLEFRSL